ncbi:hypothetical protein BX666DRAFT_2006721 [Dichotomocladium elegans]|nr:hypothetical protein BX666DRAFT_2006721 [Dichotomocladium elegans]
MSNMTQERLEEIFSQYAQTMDAFQPLDVEEDRNAERVWDEHYMWVADDDNADDDNIGEEDFINTSSRSTMSEQSIFTQTHAALSIESFSRPVSQPTPPQPTLPTPTAPPQSSTSFISLADKPLPKRPSEDTPRRKSLTPTLRGRNSNRLSWTSDMGLVAPSICQNMANELMTCFDMDFSVDIKLNTAPKLPELPFPSTTGSGDVRMKRLSNDSLMGLIPRFETFTLEEDPKPKRKSRLSQSWSRTPDGIYKTISNPPARSSSLRYRESLAAASTAVAQSAPKTRAKSRSSEFLAHFLGTSSSSSDAAEKKQQTHSAPRSSSTSRKSVRKLASFIKSGSGGGGNGKKNRATQSTPTLPIAPALLAVPQDQSCCSQQSLNSIASSVSSSSSSEFEEVLVARKTSTRKQSSSHKRRTSLTLAQPVLVQTADLRRARSLGHNRYPTTTSNETDGPICLMNHPLDKENQGLAEKNIVVEEHRHQNNFVKRMATLGRRMRKQRSM